MYSVSRNKNSTLIENCTFRSEDDPYIIFSTLYSGIDTLFVTRDLLRHEKFVLGDEKERQLFKRWQRSHQIFISYVAPSGRVYCRVSKCFSGIWGMGSRNWNLWVGLLTPMPPRLVGGGQPGWHLCWQYGCYFVFCCDGGEKWRKPCGLDGFPGSCTDRRKTITSMDD